MAAGHSRPENTIRCGNCRAENFPYAAFCISCGEPFDGAEDNLPSRDTGSSLPEVSTERPRSRGVQPFTISLSTLARRETLLGIALLLFVVGFALYQWRHTNDQAQAFRQGLALEKAKDWDRAVEAFDRAGDFPGAAAMKDGAKATAAQRDQIYLQGVAALDRNQWTLALRSFEQVEVIQPGFGNNAGRMQQVRTQLAMLELSGIIYRVSEGQGQGLYYIDGTGHTMQLPGSDKYSTVRAISHPGNQLAYDRPATLAGYGLGRTDLRASVQGVLSDNKRQNQREIVEATIGPRSISTQAVADIDTEGTGIFAPRGLWWYGPPQGSTLTQGDVSYINNHTEVYGTVLIRRSQDKRVVLAADPPRSRLIMGQEIPELSTGRVDTAILMADLSGNINRMVSMLPGSVESAAVSRDGRWLLVTARQDSGTGPQKVVWAQSLDLRTDPTDGHQLPGQTIQLSAVPLTGYPPSHLSASFVPSDAAPVHVLVSQVVTGTEELDLHTLDSNLARTLWNTEMPANNPDFDQAGFSNNGELLASPRRNPWGTVLEMISLARPDYVRWFNVPLPAAEDQPVELQFSSRNDYILAQVQKYKGMTAKASIDVYAAHVGQYDYGSLGVLNHIATATLNGLSTVAATSGGTRVVYVNGNGELHAVRYDGESDVTIAQGASAVWSLGTDADLGWTR